MVCGKRVYERWSVLDGEGWVVRNRQIRCSFSQVSCSSGKTCAENLYAAGNIPHDWLFAEGRVAAVCHHGGKAI